MTPGPRILAAPALASALALCAAGPALAQAPSPRAPQAAPPAAQQQAPAAAAQAASAGVGRRCVAPAAPRPLDAAARRSVVVTDRAALRDEAPPAGEAPLDMSIGRTLGAVVASMPGMVDTRAERIALMASLVRTFRAPAQRHPDNPLTLPIAPRPGEAALDPIQLLDPAHANGLRLVGAFNRLDLAPADWSNCGEHRLVYAKGDPPSPANPASFIDRLTVIFEARVDNPNPALGQAGCRPVAAFWDGLRGKTGRDLTRALEGFYFRGDTDGDGAPDLPRPVIDARHLGLGLGQVRGNLFVTAGDPNANPWQLREWRVAASAGGAPVFEADTVKENPIPALYGAGQPPEGPPDPAVAFEALRKAFGDEFVETTVSRITSLDRAGFAQGGRPVSEDALVAAMGAGFEPRFNAFVSVSQTLQDDPTAIAAGTPPAGGVPLPDRVEARLDEFVFARRCDVTAEHLLNRAGAMSCGGCHQFSGGRPVAAGIAWPTTRPVPAPPGAPPGTQLFDFVHIDEAGEVSPALEDRFLPERRRHLERVLQDTAPAVVAAAAPAARAPAPPDARAGADAGAPRAAAGPSPEQAAVAEGLVRLRGAETRTQALQALTELEAQVAAARAREAAQPGAFMPYRRVH